jgi:hypothetical protein
MIEPQNRVAGAHSPEVERALLHTVAGQADLANPALGRQCGDCAWFQTQPKRARTKGRCGLCQQRMQGRVGAVLARTQGACRQFLPVKS